MTYSLLASSSPFTFVVEQAGTWSGWLTAAFPAVGLVLSIQSALSKRLLNEQKGSVTLPLHRHLSSPDGPGR